MLVYPRTENWAAVWVEIPISNIVFITLATETLLQVVLGIPSRSKPMYAPMLLRSNAVAI